MSRWVLPLVLSLFACSATKAPPKDDDAAHAAPTDDTDGHDDVGDDERPDSGGDGPGSDDDGAGDTADDDTADGDTGSGDTGAGDTAGDTGGQAPGPDGEALYASHCAACHGADGQGTGAGPDIVSEVEGRSDASLVDIILNGKDEMPAQAVTETEAQAIIDWMRGGF